MSFVEAIGVVAGTLGIVQFGLTNFADTTEPGSTIKVAVGLDGENGGTEDAGGDLPDVRIWNDFGEFKAMTADPGSVGDGTVGTVEVDHDQQGVYSLLTANNDAICIAWVTTTWSDAAGGNKFAVSGDYGEACGGTWYESNMWTDTDQSYQPKCFWIDADGDQPNTGFQVRWPRYAKQEFDEGNTDPANICNDIDFGLRTEEDPSDINFWTDASKARRDMNISKRRNRVRQVPRVAWAAEQLVVSNSTHHSAQRLCDSDTSMGPDFVHLAENYFCDMGTKTKYPLCGESTESATVTDSCFDIDSHNLLKAGSKRGVLTKRDSPYTKVRDWANGN
ncbi:hypothetical protein ASPSYDRAFT_164879 [Aspergillus sydowii CBS 593.65]|uniref:Uncharacterized protein n=1 Tax=Aspergillus sydowii CBS 593.65 TaxID=1036612 RepID=A0A1L9SYZ4_9EURO|nr:uncharacterized protein ASPSYDRAFT_164879 [Aspergillus sydowii CBS 593.65]OJJ52389.1 hypothetical protein ASPSYDRAFT_164879 [Aspergillus sydowii CBS 593.65]